MSLADLIAFDRSKGNQVAGCDEAGRGCFAGPLVAAGVRFDYRRFKAARFEPLLALNDSKKLSEKTREALFPIVMELAAAVHIVEIPSYVIDEKGLHKMNLHANYMALAGVANDKSKLLADGFALPEVDGVMPLKVIRGDATSAAIAAASIIAKVTRDRIMKAVDEEHPGYGFAKNAGYGTKSHQQALRDLGLTPYHRLSFSGVVELSKGLR